MSIASAPARLLRRLAYCFGPDSAYRGLSDKYKAFVLRFAAEPRAGRPPGGNGKTATMRLKSLDTLVHVRRATSDFLVLRDIFEDGEYEQSALFNLPADATILDLGANIGLSVLYFATLCPQSRFIAVEPDAGNVAMTRLNCRNLIDAGRATIVQAFVASTDGHAAIDRTDDAWGFKKSDGTTTSTAPAESISCISIPSLLRQSGWDRIDLLKCDVEGTEAELFVDCREWIGKVRHLIVETHPPYTPDRLFDDLKRGGWDYTTVYTNLYTPSPRIFLSRA
ncbi:MAG TPA: FkbM family methyltransferase [Tepidisphaeraceae bacterium]